MDLNKTAFNYNMPRHKLMDTTKEDPRPEKSKAPLKINLPQNSTSKTPSKPLKRNDITQTTKTISSLTPLEEQSTKAVNKSTIDDYIPPTFQSQVPLSGSNEDDSQFFPDESGFLHLTPLKPNQNRIPINDNNVSSFYNNRFFDFEFDSQIPTTNDDDIPDLVPTTDTTENLLK